MSSARLILTLWRNYTPLPKRLTRVRLGLEKPLSKSSHLVMESISVEESGPTDARGESIRCISYCIAVGYLGLHRGGATFISTSKEARTKCKLTSEQYKETLESASNLYKVYCNVSTIYH